MSIQSIEKCIRTYFLYTHTQTVRHCRHMLLKYHRVLGPSVQIPRCYRCITSKRNADPKLHESLRTRVNTCAIESNSQSDTESQSTLTYVSQNIKIVDILTCIIRNSKALPRVWMDLSLKFESCYLGWTATADATTTIHCNTITASVAHSFVRSHTFYFQGTEL